MKQIKKTVTVKGLEIATHIHDRGTDLTWIFLHGWGANKAVWKNIIKRIPYTSIAVDLPGFGQSDDLDSPWSIADYRDVVVELVQQLKKDSVILVGHSFGGQIATGVAAKNPEWISGLVLVDAAVVRSPEPKLLSTLGHWLSPLFQLPGLRRLKGPLYDLIGADRPPENDNLKTTMRTILREDQREQLKQITFPIHIIWGEHDKDAPLAKGRKVKSAAQNATMSVLSGGHHIFLDNSDQFIKELEFYNQKIA
jgi:pimeloyl-ACP methyl ester carboxylesterase